VARAALPAIEPVKIRGCYWCHKPVHLSWWPWRRDGRRYGFGQWMHYGCIEAFEQHLDPMRTGD